MTGIGPSLVKLFWSLVHYYHILLSRANTAWCAVEKEKNEIIKKMKRQVFFIYLSFRIAFLVCFWENVWFISYVACYYSVACVGKHSNSRSQMFYKIDSLKNLAIFTGKHWCWRFFLINFIKKRLQHKCFPVNIAKCFSTAFYVEFICKYEFFEYYAMSSFFFRSVLARHG